MAAGRAAEIALFSVSRVAAGERKQGTLYALLVGVGKYKMAGLNLRGPINDTENVAELLAQNERRTFSRVEKRELLDHQATRAHVESSLEAMVAKAKPEDLILLYFSGLGERTALPIDANGGTRAGSRKKPAGAQSGETVEKGDDLQQVSLLLHDCDRSKGRITQPDLLALLGTAKAERLVVILDF